MLPKETIISLNTRVRAKRPTRPIRVKAVADAARQQDISGISLYPVRTDGGIAANDIAVPRVGIVDGVLTVADRVACDAQDAALVGATSSDVGLDAERIGIADALYVHAVRGHLRAENVGRCAGRQEGCGCRRG